MPSITERYKTNTVQVDPAPAAPVKDQPHRPNLLDLAREITHDRTSWEVSETIYLVPGRVYLKNENCFVSLRILGYPKGLIVSFLDILRGVWRDPVNLESDYQVWSTDARRWMQLGGVR